MIIYVIRHQIRSNDVSFYSSLIDDGLYLAETKTKEELNNLYITQIYSSPFLRTLQTIEPYINQINMHYSIPKCINIEYSLYEYISKIHFNQNNYLHFPDKLWHSKYKINKNYKSYLHPSEIKYGECIYDVKKRVNNFLKYLINTYQNTNQVILLVTHMQIIHSILEIMEIPNNGINVGQIIRII